jgi:twitching motility protein PilT
MPPRFRTVEKEFVAASWRNAVELGDFLERSRGLPAPELVRLVPHLAPEVRITDTTMRQRAQAFAALCEGLDDGRLFQPLLRACLKVEGPARNALLPVLVRCCAPRQATELCQLLRAPEPRTRRFAAALLKTVGGPATLPGLGAILRDPNAPRLEVMDLALQLGEHRAVDLIVPLVSEGSEEERARAVALLGDASRVRGKRGAAMEAISQAIDDVSIKVATQALRTLYRLAKTEAFFARMAVLLQPDADPQLQFVAVEVLAGIPLPQSIRLLGELATVGPVAVREACVRSLGRIESPDVLPPLERALGDRSLTVRNAAMDAVMTLGRAGRVPLDRMLVWLLRSPDLQVRRQAIEIASELGDPEGTLWPRMLTLLKDEDWWVRERVVETLVELAGLELTPHLVAYLKDDNDVLRRHAIEVLIKLRDPRSLGALVRTAGEDPDWWVREKAVEALGAIGDQRVVRHVVKLAEDKPELLLPALSALGRLRDPEALGLVYATFSHDDAHHRKDALKAAAAIGDPGGVRYVEQLLEDPDFEVRELAEKLMLGWTGQASDRSGQVSKRLTGLELLLWRMSEAGGDDLFLMPGNKPHMKRMGEVVPLSEVTFTGDDVKQALTNLLTPVQIEGLLAGEDVDFSVELRSQSLRFRANVHRQRNGWGGVFRRIADQLHTFADLGLPPILSHLSAMRDGLILVGGATGSGKSTTLAAMVNHINVNHARNIITVEDPIEVVHDNLQSLVTQREVGSHAPTWGSALRATLRQDPDVILVGELRDRETIGFALSAAETGHLVLGTLHTVTADASIDRIVDAFPPDEQPQVRAMVAQTLRAVLCQQLVRQSGGDSRVAALEILMVNDAAAHLIRQGQTFKLPSVIATGARDGMQTMDRELMRLVEQGTITPDDAWLKAVDKGSFSSQLAEKGLEVRSGAD